MGKPGGKRRRRRLRTTSEGSVLDNFAEERQVAVRCDTTGIFPYVRYTPLISSAPYRLPIAAYAISTQVATSTQVFLGFPVPKSKC